MSEYKILPLISPLTDSKTLRHSEGFDAIAKNISSNGFDSLWLQGQLQVSDVDSSIMTLKKRATSSVVFSRKSSSRQSMPASFLPSHSQSNNRPPTPDAGVSQPLPIRNCMSASSTGSRRFARLAQSVDSFHKLSSSDRITTRVTPPSANLSALSESSIRGRLAASAGLQIGSPKDSQQVKQTLPEMMPTSNTPAWQSRVKEALRSIASKAQQQGPSIRPGTANVPSHQLSSPAVQNMNLDPSERLTSFKEMGSMERRPATSCGVKPFVRRAVPNPSIYKPKRSDAFHVFNAIDKDLNGKLTRSELQNEAVILGFSLEKANELFDKLDSGGKGYVTTVDWGQEGTYDTIERFSLQYMRKNMGLPGLHATSDQMNEYYRMRELKKIKSMTAALQFIRLSAVSAGTRLSSASGNPIYDAFSFIDTDGSGELSLVELQDGFAAMGVHLADNLAQKLMEMFDKDKSGAVKYDEFVKTLFPLGTST